MPSLAELKTRLIAEANRDDMGAGGELENVLAEAIARAIEFHADEAFWFNRASVGAATIASEPMVALPAGLRIALAVACDGAPLRKVALGEMAALAGAGRPSLWAENDGGIQLWPVPDAAWPLTIAGIAELGVPADSNEWTGEGYDLIAARARLLLYRDTLRDLDGARLAAEAEEEALARLRRETRRRGRTAMTSELPILPAFGIVAG